MNSCHPRHWRPDVFAATFPPKPLLPPTSNVLSRTLSCLKSRHQPRTFQNRKNGPVFERSSFFLVKKMFINKTKNEALADMKTRYEIHLRALNSGQKDIWRF
uniref:Uncharacterized protein n=1 Tax=Cacopsylla melanoneura TaxID=428564 RepID=A0A8D8LS57_9HEMI